MTQVHRLVTKININKTPMVFKPGDLIWLHLRKDRFPNEYKSSYYHEIMDPSMC